MNFDIHDEITIYRGSTEQMILDFRTGANETPADYTGSEFRMTIALKDEDDVEPIIEKSTEDADGLAVATVLDEDGNSIQALVWTPTPVESRLIPRGKRAYMEIERRIDDTQELWLIYRLKGVGGISRD